MSDPSPNRRDFFGWLTWLLGGLAAVAVAVPLVGYFLGAGRRRRTEWIDLGPADAFPAHETRLATFDNPLRRPWDGMTGRGAAYVRSLGRDRFQVFAVNCTHLGCPVTWFPQSGLFMCPCHGGVYYEDGAHASGPPPRGLYHIPHRLRGGRLEIQAPHLPTLQDTLTQDSPGA
jgi:menaquinol-cytochrome c reductase iron-sulfur subunit